MDSPPRDATARDRLAWSINALLLWIADKQEAVVAAIDDLRAAVGDLQTSAQSENSELSAVVAELGTVEAQLTQLQGQVAQGAGVSEADLAAVTESVTGIARAAESAVQSAKSDPAVVAGQPPATPPATPATPAQPAQSVYVFDGDPSTVDATVWPSSGFETAEAVPRQLFYYSGDTAGTTNGDGQAGLWHVYTGPVQATGAGTAEA